MRRLWIDTEVYSPLPISSGVYRYAERAEILLVAWALDDGPVDVVDLTAGGALPAPLLAALEDPETVLCAHNAAFDRVVLRTIGVDPPITRWFCTMAQALAHSLPGSLDALSKLYGLGDAAKAHGKDYIRLFCMPRPKTHKLRRATRETHPEEWAAFVAYAAQDIVAARALHARMPQHNYGFKTEAGRRELALWHLDQMLNDRGIAVDLDLAAAAEDCAKQLQGALQERVVELTAGDVTSAMQRDKLLSHLRSSGLLVGDLRSSSIERLLEDPALPAEVRALLEVRQEASRTATRKYPAVARSACEDGRLRGLLQFCGASRTGRWAGRVFQPQNLPRPPKYLKGAAYDDAIAAIKRRDVSGFDRPMEVLCGVLRGLFVPSPGHRFAVADYSNIEGRVLAWLASEQWKLDAYRSGADLYVAAYSRAFRVPEEAVVADAAAGGTLRQIGKVMELALGYQGSVGAFGTMASAYGVSLPEDEVVEVVRAWRKANPRIVSLWYDAEEAARSAITTPGVAFSAGALQFKFVAPWLYMLLPSGRLLCYPKARVQEDGRLAYEGVNQYTRAWGTIETYGGKLVENATQAVARDVLAAALPAVEAAGFRVLLTIHDEIVSEVPVESPLNGEILAAVMTELPPWAEGLPIAAVGHDLDRYRKL